MAAFETCDDVSRRSLEELFHLAAMAAVRTVAAFVCLKSDAINVVPVFDGDTGDELAGFERKGVAANVPMPAGAADFGKNALVCFEQNAVDVLAMPDRDAGNASRIISEHGIGDAAGAATYFSVFLCRF